MSFFSNENVHDKVTIQGALTEPVADGPASGSHGECFRGTAVPAVGFSAPSGQTHYELESEFVVATQSV